MPCFPAAPSSAAASRHTPLPSPRPPAGAPPRPPPRQRCCQLQRQGLPTAGRSPPGPGCHLQPGNARRSINCLQLSVSNIQQMHSEQPITPAASELSYLAAPARCRPADLPRVPVGQQRCCSRARWTTAVATTNCNSSTLGQSMGDDVASRSAGAAQSRVEQQNAK